MHVLIYQDARYNSIWNFNKGFLLQKSSTRFSKMRCTQIKQKPYVNKQDALFGVIPKLFQRVYSAKTENRPIVLTTTQGERNDYE